MKRETRLLLAQLATAAATLVVLGLWLAATFSLLRSTFTEQEIEAVALLLEPRLAPLLLMVLVLAGAMMAAAQWFHRRYVAPPAQLLEQARVLLETNATTTLLGQGNAAVRGLADRDRLRAMSLAARRRFDTHPTWEQSMERVREFLQMGSTSQVESI